MLTISNNPAAINFVVLQLNWLVKEIKKHLASGKVFNCGQQAGWHLILQFQQSITAKQRAGIVDEAALLVDWDNQLRVLNLTELDKIIALKIICQSFMFLAQHLNVEYKNKKISRA